jgi:signal recognition particle GTPase
MANLTINDELYTQVSRIARTSHVSVEGQEEELLSDTSVRQQKSQELIAQFEAIAGMTPKGVVQTPSEILIREDRDR